jgi:hypothetical protein
MNRRTLLRRIGATGIVATTFGGPSAARPADRGLDVALEVDASEAAGRVTLAELLDETEIEQLPDHVDPDRREYVIQAEAESVRLSDCCVYCCDRPLVCDCICCECEDPPC